MDSVERLRECASGIRRMGACSIESFELERFANEIESMRKKLRKIHELSQGTEE